MFPWNPEYLREKTIKGGRSSRVGKTVLCQSSVKTPVFSETRAVDRGHLSCSLLITVKWKPLSLTENMQRGLHETLEDSCITIILWLVWAKDNS